MLVVMDVVEKRLSAVMRCARGRRSEVIPLGRRDDSARAGGGRIGGGGHGKRLLGKQVAYEPDGFAPEI